MRRENEKGDFFAYRSTATIALRAFKHAAYSRATLQWRPNMQNGIEISKRERGWKGNAALPTYGASFGLEKCRHSLPFSTILLISFHEAEVAVYARIWQSLLSSPSPEHPTVCESCISFEREKFENWLWIFLENTVKHKCINSQILS